MFFFILILIGHWQVTILMPQFFLQTTATGGVLQPTHIGELNKLITYIKG